MTDSYLTINGPSEGEFKDRGSKFIAYAFPAYSEAEWQECLDVVKKMHSKARHHCYAYRLGLDGQQFRANDDGEPSGTAGRPILGQIDSAQLTNVIVIVVRYFGGTKLGTSGLINAYKLSTVAALAQAEVIEKLVSDVFQLDFDYAIMSDVMNAVKKMDLDIRKQEFQDKGMLQIAIRQSEVAPALLRLKALITNKSLEEVSSLGDDWVIEGLVLEKVSTE